jgi:hypothetical protein
MIGPVIELIIRAGTRYGLGGDILLDGSEAEQAVQVSVGFRRYRICKYKPSNSEYFYNGITSLENKRPRCSR